MTGPWGCGKSSVLNLLEERTKDKYEIIKFNSIIECKFEVKELLEFFLLKLLSACTNEKHKEEIKQLVKSILSSVSVNLFPVSVDGEKLVKAWEKAKSAEFSEQIKNLNKALDKNNINPIVFIDDIDRLPAVDILKFLTFARFLEDIESIICIIAFDYEQVLGKLTQHFTIGSDDKDSRNIAMQYLEKFFFLRYEICASLRAHALLSYAAERAEAQGIQIKGVKLEKDALLEITRTLGTPRNVKRWIAELLRVKAFIRSDSPCLLLWLKLTAQIVRYPEKMTSLRETRTFPWAEDCKDKKEEIRSRIDEANSQLPNEIPRFYIDMYLDGIEDESECRVIEDFFSGSKTHEIIKKVIDNDYTQVMIEDIANLCSKGNSIDSSAKIEIETLAKFGELVKDILSWPSRIEDSRVDILFAVFNCVFKKLDSKIDDIKKYIQSLSAVSLCLSAIFIDKYLESKGFGLDPERKIFILFEEYKNKVSSPTPLSGDIKEVVLEWIKQCETKLQEQAEKDTLKPGDFIVVCYRYLYLNNNLVDDNAESQEKLVSLLKPIFKDKNKTDFKSNFVEFLYAGYHLLNNYRRDLFNNDLDFLRLIKEYADANVLRDLRYYSKLFEGIN